jgi:hypothetical protein
MFGIPQSTWLIGGVIAAIIGLSSFVWTETPSPVSVSLSPTTVLHGLDTTATVTVVVQSRTPVNAFGGLITFDPTLLRVERIDYNQSIADLWAETPWYENGDGTIEFAGGSTIPGGFSGTGTLLTITFRTLAVGEGSVKIARAQILAHDGLGTEVPLQEPLETLFSISTSTGAPAADPRGNDTTMIVVTPVMPKPDLNNDGRHSLADVSILMQYLITGNLAGDLNGDGRVTLADLSIILEYR